MPLGSVCFACCGGLLAVAFWRWFFAVSSFTAFVLQMPPGVGTSRWRGWFFVGGVLACGRFFDRLMGALMMLTGNWAWAGTVPVVATVAGFAVAGLVVFRGGAWVYWGVKPLSRMMRCHTVVYARSRWASWVGVMGSMTRPRAWSWLRMWGCCTVSCRALEKRCT